MKEENNFPENLIVTTKGELVELGDDLETPWGFTVEGFKSNLKFVHGFSRNWKSLDEFLNLKN